MKGRMKDERKNENEEDEGGTRECNWVYDCHRPEETNSGVK